MENFSWMSALNIPDWLPDKPKIDLDIMPLTINYTHTHLDIPILVTPKKFRIELGKILLNILGLIPDKQADKVGNMLLSIPAPS